MAYISSSDLRLYLGTTSTSEDTLLGNAVSAACAYIDHTCGRTFEGTTGTRYYQASAILDLEGLGGPQLYLGADLVALGGITNGDGTTIASTDLRLQPRNGPPYGRILLKTAVSWGWETDGEITVTGTWGYSSTAPEDIKEAAKQLAAYYYKLKSSQVFDTVASPETGTITIPKGVPASVARILKDGGYIKQRVIT